MWRFASRLYIQAREAMKRKIRRQSRPQATALHNTPEKPIFATPDLYWMRQRRVESDELSRAMIRGQPGEEIFRFMDTLPLRAPEGLQIDLTTPLLEGKFNWTLYDNQGNKLGWLGIDLHGKDSLSIIAVQGGTNVRSLQRRLHSKTGSPWANHLMEALISHARKSGIKELLFIKSKKQPFIRMSKNPEGTAKLYDALKEKYLFEDHPTEKRYDRLILS